MMMNTTLVLAEISDKMPDVSDYAFVATLFSTGCIVVLFCGKRWGKYVYCTSVAAIVVGFDLMSIIDPETDRALIDERGLFAVVLEYVVWNIPLLFTSLIVALQLRQSMVARRGATSNSTL